MTALRAEPFGDTQSSLVLSISHATWDIDAVPRHAHHVQRGRPALRGILASHFGFVVRMGVDTRKQTTVVFRP